MNKSKYVLIKWDGNWADEISWVTTQKKWEESQVKLRNFTDLFYIYFGTNEENAYINGSELVSEFSVRNISKLEYDTFISLIGSDKTYHFPSFPEDKVNEDENEY